MKEEFYPGSFCRGGVLMTCSSHEERCLALVRRWGNWRPRAVVVYHYDDSNPRREKNHAELRRLYDAGSETTEISFTEKDAVGSFRKSCQILGRIAEELQDEPIIFDITVFTKRHLLMMLRWIDDAGWWGRLSILYSEPEEYEVTEHLPLSFGVAKVEEVPGFSAAPNASRPLHMVIFLGYEGDRTLATYEIIQPSETTLVIPDPPFREEWKGRTERFNRDLIAVVGSGAVRRVDGLDPDASRLMLREILGHENERSDFARMICPLGTKPQAVGAYLYTRQALDPPALIYTGPLRHNHAYFSRGMGRTWILLGK